MGPGNVVSWAALGVGSIALTIGAFVIVMGVGAHAPAGPGGRDGNNGVPGSNGSNGAGGAQGAPGPGASWGALDLTFSLGGKATGLAITAEECTTPGHGAYACEVNISSSASAAQRITGLSYTPNADAYYAGADPTLGWIVLSPGSTSSFTLWFQAVSATGTSSVEVTLLVGSSPGP